MTFDDSTNLFFHIPGFSGRERPHLQLKMEDTLAQMPHAVTRTSTSPRPGSGVGRSRTWNWKGALPHKDRMSCVVLADQPLTAPTNKPRAI
jgi:hypothetical protein